MTALAYIGTYTDATKRGIHVIRTDCTSGEITPANVVTGIENPTYLALSRHRPLLYAVQGIAEYGDRDHWGALSIFEIGADGTTLTQRAQAPVAATVPCHIALNHAEDTLAYAEYSHATAGVFRLDEQGLFATSTPLKVKHHGRGPDPNRQEAAHAHCAIFTPDGTALCVADLGLDRVVAYRLPVTGGSLMGVPALTIRSAAGAGPRHLLFHHNGQLAFLLNELDSTLSVYGFDGDTFRHKKTLSALPASFSGDSKAAALKLSADGCRLLTSNRGYDSIATFAVDPASGEVELLTIAPLSGTFPRDFALLPQEKFVLVAHETSHTVQTYAFDAATGQLTAAAAPYQAHRPVCVVCAANN